MASKQNDLAKIIENIRNQVEEAKNKIGNTRIEVKQQVTDLQRQVSEFEKSANKVSGADPEINERGWLAQFTSFTCVDLGFC